VAIDYAAQQTAGTVAIAQRRPSAVGDAVNPRVSVNQKIEPGAAMRFNERERQLIERMRRYASAALWEKFEAELDEQGRKFQ